MHLSQAEESHMFASVWSRMFLGDACGTGYRFPCEIGSRLLERAEETCDLAIPLMCICVARLCMWVIRCRGQNAFTKATKVLVDESVTLEEVLGIKI